MNYVFSSTLEPAFTRWLAPATVRGLAVSDTQLAIATADGTTWTVNLNDEAAARRFLVVVETSGRRPWAWRAVQAVRTLTERLQLDVDELTFVRDAVTAHAVIRPLVRFRPRAELDRFSTEQPDLIGNGAVRDAIAVAKAAADISLRTPNETRPEVLHSCDQESLWRRRQVDGIRLDVELLRAEKADAETTRALHAAEYGIDFVDTTTDRCKARIHHWLGQHGIKITTRDGRLTLARDAYDYVRVPMEAEDAWSAFRKARKVASRLGKLAELEKAAVDGVLYPQINIRDTRTGRGTVRKPALQNIHKDLRPLLIAPEGYLLVSLDLDQAEVRVAAGLSQCEALLAALNAADFYTEIARKVWGDEAFDSSGVVLVDRRNQAKRLIIAIFYGLGSGAIAYEFGISWDEAAALIAGMWNMFPGLTAFDAHLQTMVREDEDLYTMSMRPVPSPKKRFAALNNVVQANAADIFYDGVTRTAAVVGAEHLYLAVHDELVLCVPEGREEWAAAALNENMPSLFRGVPVTGSAQILGRAWRK